MKKNYRVLLKIIISITILFYIFFKLEFEKIILSFSEINYLYLVPSLLLLFLSLFIMVIKWNLVLKKYLPYNTNNIFLLYWASDFTNLFGLGAIGGEAYKMSCFNEKKKALFTSLFDKVLSFYWYLFLGLSVFCSYSIFKHSLSGVAFFSLLFYCLSTLFTLFLNSYRENIIKTIPIKGVRDFINKINIDNKTILFHSFFAFLLIFNTAIIYSLIFKSLNLSELFFIQLLIFIPILLLATTLPISFQGIGVREYLFIEFAKINSITLETALLCSLLVYLLCLVYRVTGIIPFLLKNNSNN